MLALAVASVGLSAVGPKILGRATDHIFAGVVGARFPVGADKAQLVAQLRARGEDTVADLVSGMPFLVPGRGIDFGAVGDVLLLVLGIYCRGEPALVGAGLAADRGREPHHLRAAP